MKTLRNYWLQRTLLWLLIIVVVNRSVDAPDALIQSETHTLSLEEDLSINEMESILEWVMEKCLDVADAFPEEQEDDSQHDWKKMDCFSLQQSYAYLKPQVFQTVTALHFSFHRLFLPSPSQDITSPPPKA